LEAVTLDNLSVGTVEPVFYSALGVIAEIGRMQTGTNATSNPSNISIFPLNSTVGMVVYGPQFGPTDTTYSVNEWQTTSTGTGSAYVQPQILSNTTYWQSANQITGLPERLDFSNAPPARMGVGFGETIYLSQQLEEMMDAKALHWLATEPKLVGLLHDLSESTRNLFHDRAISAAYQITTFADPEAEQVPEKLLFEVKIRNKPYSEILQLWDELATRLLSNLPIEIQKKITLVLDEA
jgi:hypothetical protein